MSDPTTYEHLETSMVTDIIPFTFPRTGRMTVTSDDTGNLSVVFSYLNGHGAAVSRPMGERTFRLVALDAAGQPDYLPEVLGEGVRTLSYLSELEVDTMLTRIAGMPERA